jgi:hypothetical protein
MSISLAQTIIDFGIGYLLAGFAVSLCAREFLSIELTIPRAVAVIFLWPLAIDRTYWNADGRDVEFQRGVEAAVSIVDDSANDALLHYPVSAGRHHILKATAKAIREEAAAKYAYALRFSSGACVGANLDTRRQRIQALQKGDQI